jgi:hypothetical protein
VGSNYCLLVGSFALKIVIPCRFGVSTIPFSSIPTEQIQSRKLFIASPKLLKHRHNIPGSQFHRLLVKPRNIISLDHVVHPNPKFSLVRTFPKYLDFNLVREEKFYKYPPVQSLFTNYMIIQKVYGRTSIFLLSFVFRI